MTVSSGTPTLVGLIGHPAAGNPTGTMMEAASAEAGWTGATSRWTWHGAAVAGQAVLGFRGFNVTMPYKVEILPLLDRPSPAVELIGASNTVVRKGDGWFGRGPGDRGDGHDADRDQGGLAAVDIAARRGARRGPRGERDVAGLQRPGRRPRVTRLAGSPGGHRPGRQRMWISQLTRADPWRIPPV